MPKIYCWLCRAVEVCYVRGSRDTVEILDQLKNVTNLSQMGGDGVGSI